ncbi:MAG: two-component regulator propeller domain-containing protein [Bacteroidales bacterium]
MKYFLVILFLIIELLSLNAAPHLTHNYAFRYYTTRDGLVQMQVLCAFQDRDGYMWFGTKGGVSRYDGISFKNYTHEDGIPVGEIHNIGEWGNKKLFFLNSQFVILHENDRLEHVYIPDSLTLNNCSVQSFEISKDEIMLMNFSNPNRFSNDENFRLHLIWNIKSKTFRVWKKIDNNILTISNDYIVTSNAVYRKY